MEPISQTNQSQEPSPKRKRSQGNSPRQSVETRPLDNGASRKREEELLEQYGCGPIQFAGSGNASYERHLMFDNVMPLGAAGARERFEALARAVRDLLSQRWVRTEAHYARKNPKRVYYLSMEFLIGRSLANNVTNLLLSDPDRLLRLLTDRRRPVQLILAGKAHPRDQQGKAMIQEWLQFLRRARGRALPQAPTGRGEAACPTVLPDSPWGPPALLDAGTPLHTDYTKGALPRPGS